MLWISTNMLSSGNAMNFYKYVVFWQRCEFLQICCLLTILWISTNMLSSGNAMNCYKYVVFWQRYEFLQICYLLTTLGIATNMLSSELCSLYVYINVITAPHDCPNKNRNKYIHYITMVVFSSTEVKPSLVNWKKVKIHSTRIEVFAFNSFTGYVTRLTQLVPLVEQELLTRSLVLCVCFVDRCLSICSFSLLAIVCYSSIYGFWLPPFGIFKLFINLRN